MKSIVEPLDDNRVKLTVEVPEAEIEAEVDEAFKRLAHQVRMPGFRPGRAPRKLLEAQLGPGAGRSEALRSSVHKYYDLAVIEHDVDVIDLPEIEIIDGQESGSMSFGAVVEVRPRVSIAGYEGLRIEVPNPAIDDAEIEEQVDRFRRTFAELVSVGRPASDGDHVTIDITGTVGAETIAGLTASDYDYVVGTGAVVAEIDENLRGAAVGDILEFEAEHPEPDEDRPLRFRVLVKEVSETVLPDLDDELVAAHTEHATAAEFRDEIEARQQTLKVLQCCMAMDRALAESLAELVAEEPPRAMVDRHLAARLEDLDERLREKGGDLESVERPWEEIVERFRPPAVLDAKLDLALRAVAAAEGLEATDADVYAEFEQAAADSDGDDDPEQIRARMAEAGRLLSLRASLSKQAALAWVRDRVVLIDSDDGTVIDREALEFPEGEPEEQDAPDAAELPGAETDDPKSRERPDGETDDPEAQEEP